LKAIEKALNRFCAFLSYCGSVWIFLLMIVITVDVVGRVAFNSPLRGTPEIVKFSIVGIAFFMMAWSMYDGSHVRSTMILGRVSPRWQDVLNVFANLIGALLFAAIIYASWDATVQAWITGEYEGEGALRVPTYPVRFVIILGSVLMIWQCLRGVYYSGKSLATGQRDSDQNSHSKEVV